MSRLKSQGGRKGWAILSRVNASIPTLSPSPSLSGNSHRHLHSPQVGALRLPALLTKPNLQHTQASGLHVDVQVPG